jgi:hypothetical protein
LLLFGAILLRPARLRRPRAGSQVSGLAGTCRFWLKVETLSQQPPRIMMLMMLIPYRAFLLL